MTTETYSIAITIVGTTPGGDAFGDELRALTDGIAALLPEVMPSFTLAHPPMSVTTFELLGAPEHRRISPLVASAEHEIVVVARKLVETIHGDGNGRCWCDAGAADRLRAAIVAWERFPE